MLIKQDIEMTERERIAVQNSNNRYLQSLSYIAVGTIFPYAGKTCPEGFMVCDGSSLDVVEYAELFNVIGYSFGGSGDYFKLPNMLGRMPVGLDSSISDFNTVGKNGGQRSVKLTVAQLPRHQHDVRLNDAGTEQASGFDWKYSTTSRLYSGEDMSTYAGNNEAHENMPPYLVVNYIIKVFNNENNIEVAELTSSNASNALKGTKSGKIVAAKDVSPIEHNLSVKLTSSTLTNFSGVKVSRYGKNLFNPKILTDAGFALNSNGYYVGKVKTLNDFYDGYNGQLPLPDFIPNTQYTISFEGYTQKDISSSGGIYIRISYTDNTNDYLQLSIQTIKKYSRTTQKNKSVQKISVSYGAEGESLAYIKNFCICIGSDNAYEEYVRPKIYTTSSTDKVNDISSLYPSVTLLTDNPEVNIEMEYNRDINKAFAELQQAIISLGGSI